MECGDSREEILDFLLYCRNHVARGLPLMGDTIKTVYRLAGEQSPYEMDDGGQPFFPETLFLEKIYRAEHRLNLPPAPPLRLAPR